MESKTYKIICMLLALFISSSFNVCKAEIKNEGWKYLKWGMTRDQVREIIKEKGEFYCPFDSKGCLTSNDFPGSLKFEKDSWCSVEGDMYMDLT